MTNNPMKATIGDLGRNVDVLRELRNSLVTERRIHERAEVDSERWGTFSQIAESIACACNERDLEALASSVRDMKNKLRRPSVRRDLERLESKDKDADKAKNPTGECKCADCGAVVDGSKEPCVDGALCTKCALKKKVISKKEQDAKKAKKVGPPVSGQDQMPGDDGGGGAETSDEQPRESISLRSRGYLRER